jgi:hypothetical protein
MRLQVLVFFCFFYSFAQEIEKEELDSLKNILKNKNIEYKENIEILNKLSRYIGKSDFRVGMLCKSSSKSVLI